MESKTAMQQMCNHIQDLSESMMMNGGNSDAEKLKWFIEQTKSKAIELRDTVEKEQINDAVIFGNRQECYDGTETIGETYYNQTYKQQP